MDRKERIEENEKLFREVNERVKEVQANFQSGPDPQWVCECGDETCFDKLTVPLDEYQEIRSRGNWFLVLVGHEKPDVEEVVDRRDGFLVVEKDGV
jgi:hypothetical protein